MSGTGNEPAGEAVREVAREEVKGQLRACFLFEALTDEQLDWLARHGIVEVHDAGTNIYHQGAPADFFYVLLDGEIQLVKHVDGTDVVLTTASQPGAYAGATRAFISAAGEQSYVSTLRAVSRSRLFRLRSEDYAYLLKTWFPMAVHLLDGLFLGMTNAEALVGQREKLVALGSLSAGLAHELNNPAAAEVRAADTLIERLAEGRQLLVNLAPRLGETALSAMLDRLGEAVERSGTAPRLSPLEAGDLEDRLGDRLEAASVGNPWDVAAALVGAGVDEDWLERVVAQSGEAAPDTVRWLSIALDIESLVREIRSSAGRISELVAAMKGYSHLDKATFGEVDVHEGLESTVVILGHKLKKGVKVVREYDRSLPKIWAQEGELNQVWTNLIDNAVDAMDGSGTLTIRTRGERECLAVEIADTGPGIPQDVRRRIFEPFFTTKDVGQGTGLGLDISYRIVVRRHHGDIRLQSEPGDTRFTVLLPMGEGAAPRPGPTS
ncbi:MAG TPA: ATP-binding protein [Acidimicrobiales bacterium]|nr:ATP-binding protein [Acidimicrobiales bacterium]